MKKTIQCLLISLSIPCASELSEEITPIVTCHLMGALGNQLFQIATTMAYAWDYGAASYFPDLNNAAFNLTYSRDGIFFRLNPSNPPRPCVELFQELSWHSSDRIPFKPQRYLYGYFQSWTHFHHHRDKILALFSPSEAIAEHLEQTYGDLISNPHTVSVHLRTFNPTLHASKLHAFVGLSYYRQAIENFPEESLFVVFSDRINWCKHHLTRLFQDYPQRRFVYIDERDPIKSLFLMSKMKHHILANSTFSWWGAYLNENPEKIVIAPRYWTHPEFSLFPKEHPNDFYFPDWKIVEADYYEPYPIDITWYEETTSLDGNK